mgnify:CR=1 FL=1
MGEYLDRNFKNELRHGCAALCSLVRGSRTELAGSTLLGWAACREHIPQRNCLQSLILNYNVRNRRNRGQLYEAV